MGNPEPDRDRSHGETAEDVQRERRLVLDETVHIALRIARDDLILR